VAIGTNIEQVPVTGLAANFSPIPRMAPPPLGSEIEGPVCSLLVSEVGGVLFPKTMAGHPPKLASIAVYLAENRTILFRNEARHAASGNQTKHFKNTIFVE
jgi:hypothetical protein